MANLTKPAVVLLPIIAMFFLSCDYAGNPVGGDELKLQEFIIEGKYSNSATNADAGLTPQPSPAFKVDSLGITKGIKTYSVQTVRRPGQRVDIIFTDLRIFDWVGDRKINYEMAGFKFEEKVEGAWVSFTEFDKAPPLSKLNNIGIVLVLDASNSLGSDFKNVKEHAKEFINLVFQNTVDSARVGVVSFSTAINSLGIDVTSTNNEVVKAKIVEFIDKTMKQGEFTALYDGMFAGIDMLTQPLLKVDAKALVTFTDGRDNYSFRATEADTVVAQLKKLGLPSFTIGYLGKGELDQNVLKRLAYHGEFRLATSPTALKDTFRDIAVSVTDVYTVTYSRNDQIISANSPRPIRLTIAARQKS